MLTTILIILGSKTQITVQFEKSIHHKNSTNALKVFIHEKPETFEAYHLRASQLK